MLELELELLGKAKTMFEAQNEIQDFLEFLKSDMANTENVNRYKNYSLYASLENEA